MSNNGYRCEVRRGKNGRFLPGTCGGPGNPHSAKVNRLRTAMLTVLTPKKMRAIVSKLYNMAMAGDRDAIREVLNRGLRKPTTVEDET